MNPDNLDLLYGSVVTPEYRIKIIVPKITRRERFLRLINNICSAFLDVIVRLLDIGLISLSFSVWIFWIFSIGKHIL